ncbi:MAG: N-acetyl-gamma-glutamyl-phosphate reductase [Bacteroidetes bacterium]|nr:N-acetyl-gamma-glutamyl-phosphate reductase [Bacteroidota bacterium]
MNKIKLSIAGASGYTGMETIRYLLQHPIFEIHHLYGHDSAGKSVDEIYPAFAEILHQTILPLSKLAADASDAVILALPHGKSADAAHELIQAGYKGKIIDIGSDFRLPNPDDYLTWYGSKHPHPQLLNRFTYGLTEYNRAQIRNADYVANPGCFATALQMGILPLMLSELSNRYFVTGMTGSSGSGAKPSETTHFSNRFGNVKAYKVFKHQHLGEVSRHTQRIAGVEADIHFTPVSGPFVRGIWMNISGELKKTHDLTESFESVYYNSPLVRLRSSLPELKPVVGTAFTDIGWQQDKHIFSIGVAIDNMGKGAAGQMVQNLNLMFDLPEETGLMYPGIIL